MIEVHEKPKTSGQNLDKLIVLVDTREQQPLTFKQFPEVIVIKDNLNAGDYSLMGYENKIAVERKNSLDELCTAIGKGRINFVEELERTKSYDAFFLVVEGNSTDFVLGGYERSHLHPHSAIASLADWIFEYKLIPVFVNSRYEAEFWIIELFKKYLKNRRVENGK